MYLQKKINIHKELEVLPQYFSPKIVTTLNDHFVKIVKIKGDKVPWHHHDYSDELFYIFEGELKMEIESESPITLKADDLFVVKKNIKHRVSSTEECTLMLIEYKNTAHTGNVNSEITKSIDEQFRK